MSLYYLMFPYQRNMVFQHLLPKETTAVVTLDIGSSRTTAAFCRLQRGVWTEPVLLQSGEGCTSIPTQMTYGDTVSCQFRLPPSRWQEMPDGVHTAKELLFDFTRRYWANLLQRNPQLREIPPQALLIRVLCPTHIHWLKPEPTPSSFLPEIPTYANLMQKAIGYPQVTLLAEPTAAASYVRQLHQPDLHSGAAVFHMGSAFSVFWYEKQGETLIHDYIPLGSAAIEQTMAIRLLDSQRMEMNHLSIAEIQSLLAQLCLQKERWFSDEPPSIGQTIRLSPHKILEYELNESFMDGVLYHDTELEAFPQQSFLNALEYSLRASRDKLNGQPCPTILLSGGASRLPQLPALLRRIFGDCRILSTDQPDFGAVLGGCLHCIRSLKIAAQLEQAQQQAEQQRQACFREICTAYANRVADHTAALLIPILEKYLQKGGIIAAQNIKNDLITAMQAQSPRLADDLIADAASRYQAQVTALVRQMLSGTAAFALIPAAKPQPKPEPAPHSSLFQSLAAYIQKKQEDWLTAAEITQMLEPTTASQLPDALQPALLEQYLTNPELLEAFDRKSANLLEIILGQALDVIFSEPAEFYEGGWP